VSESLSQVHATSRDSFKRGDHLQVRRLWGYRHHGIYVNDQRVIQFDGRICDKPGATIEAVSLAKFEDRSKAEIVRHNRYRAPFGMWLPKADAPEKIIQRAEWLLANHPPRRRYNLVGNNCEHMANFCVSEFTESLQVRRFFPLRASVTYAVGLYLALRIRTSRFFPWQLILGAEIITIWTVVMYHYHIRRFWKDNGGGPMSAHRAAHRPVRFPGLT
jgi:hypothetical protein